MLKGVDVSSHNGSPFNSATETAIGESDFVIVKATQGTYYKNPFFADQYAFGKNSGKLMGIYHYAGGNDAVAEADYFWSVVSDKNGEFIPCLDFESYENSANWNDTDWCNRFVTRYHDLSGVYPLIYVSAAYRARAASCADRCGLWIAGYPDSRTTWDMPTFNYSTDPWDTYTVWQYTSGGGVDRNFGNLDADGWARIATGGGAAGSGASDSSGSSTMDLVYQVMLGTYGNGDARKAALGTRYDEVQEVINHIAYSSVDTLATEVIEGAYGNGDYRKTILGDRYAEVQAEVNARLL